jgi:hypothetical protein
LLHPLFVLVHGGCMFPLGGGDDDDGGGAAQAAE